MTRARLVAALVVAAALALPARAAAEPPPPVHLKSGSSVTTDRGSVLRLPPGYFVTEDGWSKLDVEVRRLQESEVRLKAENESLRDSAESWQPGWKTLAGALVAGISLGTWAFR